MYKTHIQECGLDKKIKDGEMRAVVRKNKRRADQGKRSIIYVRGQRRELEEFIRHCDRKGVSIDDIIARATSSPTPGTVELLTPVPSRMSTPQVLEVPERMLRCVRDYFLGSFESGTWVHTDPLTFCYSIKCGQEADVYGEELVFLCESGCRLFSKSLFEEGGRTLNAALAGINRIIQADQPETLIPLFRLIGFLRIDNRHDIASMLLRHFSDLSKVLLGGEHPLTLYFGWFNLLYTSDFDEIVSRCTDGMIDHFENSVGAMHISTLGFRVRSVEVLAQKGDAGIQKLLKILSECERKLLPYDHRVFLVRVSLANEYYKQSYYVEARTLSQECLDSCQYIRPEKLRTHFETHFRYMIAICRRAPGEVDSGIANLKFSTKRSTQGSRCGARRTP